MTCVIVGGGPAGLMAAQILAEAGQAVAVYDAMPTVGRKFLMAGRGGLNLTHSEPLEPFLDRYGAARPVLEPMIRQWDGAQIRRWAAALGVETFIGTSGRVFPVDFKAAPLLRSWVHHLRRLGVRFYPRHRWLGWDGQGSCRFRRESDGAEFSVTAQTVLLALGGGSWAKLGSDGQWLPLLQQAGIACAPLRPANCGFVAACWPEAISRHQGTPLKNIRLQMDDRSVRGEMMITAQGIEGGAVYALSAALRDQIERDGRAVVRLDLKPDLTETALAERISRQRVGLSLSSLLQKAAGLGPVCAALLRTQAGEPAPRQASALAALIKALPLQLCATTPVDEAISTAGGVLLDAVTEDLMLSQRPGTFVAGEMLDWEAPTGGYLLTGCLATGVQAARGMLEWLARDEAGRGEQSSEVSHSSPHKS